MVREHPHISRGQGIVVCSRKRGKGDIFEMLINKISNLKEKQNRKLVYLSPETVYPLFWPTL